MTERNKLIAFPRDIRGSLVRHYSWVIVRSISDRPIAMILTEKELLCYKVYPVPNHNTDYSQLFPVLGIGGHTVIQTGGRLVLSITAMDGMGLRSVRTIESSSPEIILEWFVHLVALWRSAYGVPRPRNLPPDVSLSERLRNLILKGVYNKPIPNNRAIEDNSTAGEEIPSIVIVPGSGRV